MGCSYKRLSCPRNCIALLLALAFHFGAAAAQQPLSTTQALHISGKVVDARSGRPLARCVVEINPTDNRSQSLSVETGDDGQFDFGGLRSGKYALSAAKRGYLTESYQQHESFSTAIAVGPEAESENLVFHLMPQAIFYGTVTDDAGDPVRKAQVRLYEDRDLDGIRSTEQVQAVITDDLGMYEMPNIAPANYFLSVSAQPWYAAAANGPMQANNAHAGTVNPALDVAYPTIFYPDATDSDDAIPIPIRGGERIEANMTLNAQHAVHLQLPLVRGQEGGTGVSIARNVFGQLEPASLNTQTNNDGVMELSGLLPGRYEVTVTHSDGQSPPESTHFTTDIAEGATQLNADTGAGEVTVSGKVTSPDSKTRFAGISLVASHPRRDYFSPVNDAGEFSVQVVPGEYQVMAPDPRMYVASISSPNALVKGHLLQVSAGAAPRLEIVAGAGYGQIDGMAERAGHPTGGVMVLLAPEDAKDNQTLFRRDQSDSDGTFLLSNIIPGRYHLLAIDEGWELNWADSNVLAAYLKKSITIQVRAHDKLKQTIEVQSR